MRAILQHEIDHLAGTMYVDHMYPRSLMTVENFTQHWKGKTLPEMQERTSSRRFAQMSAHHNLSRECTRKYANHTHVEFCSVAQFVAK